MVKIYKDLKIEEETYKRFKRAKKLLEFQNDRDYSVTEFEEILIDEIGKKLRKF